MREEEYFIFQCLRITSTIGCNGIREKNWYLKSTYLSLFTRRIIILVRTIQNCTRKSKRKEINQLNDLQSVPKNMKDSIKLDSKFLQNSSFFLSLSSLLLFSLSKISRNKEGREARQNEQNFTYPCTICPGSTSPPSVNLGLHFAHYYVS